MRLHCWMQWCTHCSFSPFHLWECFLLCSQSHDYDPSHFASSRLHSVAKSVSVPVLKTKTMLFQIYSHFGISDTGLYPSSFTELSQGKLPKQTVSMRAQGESQGAPPQPRRGNLAEIPESFQNVDATLQPQGRVSSFHSVEIKERKKWHGCSQLPSYAKVLLMTSNPEDVRDFRICILSDKATTSLIKISFLPPGSLSSLASTDCNVCQHVPGCLLFCVPGLVSVNYTFWKTNLLKLPLCASSQQLASLMPQEHVSIIHWYQPTIPRPKYKLRLGNLEIRSNKVVLFCVLDWGDKTLIHPERALKSGIPYSTSSGSSLGNLSHLSNLIFITGVYPLPPIPIIDCENYRREHS